MKEIIKNYDLYKDTKDEKYFTKANKIGSELCTNPSYAYNNKYTIFSIICRNNVELAEEILSRWRDMLAFLNYPDDMEMVNLLAKTTRCTELSSHEKIYTVVQLYNKGYIDSCYTCFGDLAFDSSIEIKHRLEAAKYLFAAGGDEREIAKECLLGFINDADQPVQYRYESIAAYITRTGISCLLNIKKLKILYNEEFVRALQYPFFKNEANDTRYRIMAGQHLLQMSTENVSYETKDEITRVLMSFAENVNLSENLRADAADVVLRLGNPEFRLLARDLIAALGRITTQNLSKLNKINTVYTDSQNVHDSSINNCIQKYILKMFSSESKYQILTFDVVLRDIKRYINNREDVDDLMKSIVYQSLDRVKIDTATFTDKEVSILEILCHVWSRIVSDEFSSEVTEQLKSRMYEELCEMNQTCSSGHASRFINVLSSVDNTFTISWYSQLKSNVSGRVNARIKNCDDIDLASSIALGMLEGSDEEDSKIYNDWLTKQLKELKIELHKEFVGEGYISEKEFSMYFSKIYNEWF